jgi:tRNA (guanine37-N1)-methyltransferase
MRANLKIDVITLFPGMFASPFSESMIRRATEKGLASIKVHDLRDFSEGRHNSVDDRPFGGSAGMLLMPGPIFRAVRKLAKGAGSKVILLSPQGRVLTQGKARQLSREKQLVLICGHYEGVDERVMKIVDEEISIGNYVLTGGELPAMVLIDAVVRVIPGVVKERDSVVNDSFYNGLLACPKYTRPRKFGGAKVPEILLSGHHANIGKWQLKESLRSTYLKKPGLLKGMKLDPEQKNLLAEIKKETHGANMRYKTPGQTARVH